MEFWLQNRIFDHIWSLDDLDIEALDLKFSEMLNIAQVILFNWQKCLAGISEWSYSSKTAFLPKFGHVVTWTFGPQIFRNTRHTALISLFAWKKSRPDTLKWSCDSKAEFLPIFGHVVTPTYDLWNQI